MVGQVATNYKLCGRLNALFGEGCPVVVTRQAGSFTGDTLKDVFDETVHDAHGYPRY